MGLTPSKEKSKGKKLSPTTECTRPINPYHQHQKNEAVERSNEKLAAEKDRRQEMN
jgi:hypothetical protein